MSENVEIKVNQVWQDRDPRYPERKVTVVDVADDKITIEYAGKRSKVRRDRMRPIGKAKGFSLVEGQ